MMEAGRPSEKPRNYGSPLEILHNFSKQILILSHSKCSGDLTRINKGHYKETGCYCVIYSLTRNDNEIRCFILIYFTLLKFTEKLKLNKTKNIII